MLYINNDTNDEYVRAQKRKFKIETLYIILLIAGLNVLQGTIRGEFSEHVIVCGILLFIASLY